MFGIFLIFCFLFRGLFRDVSFSSGFLFYWLICFVLVVFSGVAIVNRMEVGVGLGLGCLFMLVLSVGSFLRSGLL